MKRSRLKPIARWLQRRAIWLCGYDEPAIQEFLRRLDEEEATDEQLDDLEEPEDADAELGMQEQLEALGEPENVDTMEEILQGVF